MRFVFNIFSFFAIALCAEEHILSLGELGNVRYVYESQHLIRVDRLDPFDKVMYSHSYYYDTNGRLSRESLIGDLGDVIYEGDLIVKGPWGSEICEYDERHNLIRHVREGTVQEYSYNEWNQLITNDTEEKCAYDSLGNLVQKEYVRFIYDEENRLVQVISSDFVIDYAYDSSGERISKTANGETEYYAYFGDNEIAIIDVNGEIKELRIPGLSPHPNLLRPIAIETKGAVYAPIHDVQGNIVKLIDISNREVISIGRTDPFGRGLSKNAPTSWIFAGKCYDKEAGLVYFGERYYCPELKQWLTRDPLQQTANLYQYCLDNPLSFIDPDGKWAIPFLSIAWGAGTTLTTPIWAPYAAATATGALVGYLGYQVYKGFQHWQEEIKEPPFTWDQLGDDPTVCPGEGFVWKGKGTPESGRGNWVRGKKSTKEELHPDLNHPDPVGPHWDYEGPGFIKGVRIKPDGTWEYK